METQLSICTVSYNSAPFIRLNQRFVEQLNPSSPAKWIVAENSPPESPQRVDSREFQGKLICGASGPHIPIHHHTIALKKCTDLCETRFLLVIDPDFFVVLDNWIDIVIKHMLNNSIAIFAVPWHPKSGSKYRYFPAVHFAMFDTDRFQKDEIDFRPDYPDGENDPEWPNGWVKDRKYFSTSILARLLSGIPMLRRRRQFYTDTGSRLYKKYVLSKNLAIEIGTPIFDRSRALANLSTRGRLLERLLPDELCYIPKGYPADGVGPFLSTYSSNAIPRNWEEFSWRNAPLGFHVRGNLERATRDSRIEISLVEETLEYILKHRSP